MQSDDIITLFEQVRSAVYFGDSLKLLLNSSRLEELSKEGKFKVPVITPLEIFKGQKVPENQCPDLLWLLAAG
jgi:hypothetical protein